MTVGSGRAKRLTLKEKVETLIAQNGCTYLAAITHVMSEQGVPPARMAKSLCPYLFEKLQNELRYSRVVPPSILDQFYKNGRKKMQKEEAVRVSELIKQEIEKKEAIILAIKEKKKREDESGSRGVAGRRELLLYESQLEQELEVLIDLSNLCYAIVGEG